jgi:hypothetical protein
MVAKDIKLHVAGQKFRLKSMNHCLSFVSTVWDGEVILCCYNNLEHRMANIYCSQLMGPDDVEALEGLIYEKVFK